MENIVVLNSGGFDSISLLHYLSGEDNVKIHSLHFLYGARNEKQQEKCVDRVCEKLGAVNQKVHLPPFSWTHSNFFGDGYAYESQYLEYRNLIFLSYALSYAQSIGAKKIYLAVLKGGGYPDTSETFFEGINSFSKPLTDIEVLTPFSDVEYKEDLISIATQYGIQPGDYFSCDTPKEDGSRCGECLDCVALNTIDRTLEINHPFKALYQSNFDYSDKKFLDLLSQPSSYREVRALINNDCQLKCTHCFYGFEKMAEEKVDKETYYSALRELVLDHGFKNIHFSGKEPLYDDTILWYAHKIKEDNLPCSFDLVTNGINVPKYVVELKECGMHKIFLSVDEVFQTNGVRSVKNVALNAINACNRVGLPVEVFIDIHHNNWNYIGEIVKFLHTELGVSMFYVRTIRSIGNAKGQELLNSSKLNSVFKQLDSVAEDHPDILSIVYSLSSEYNPVVFNEKEEKSKLSSAILTLDSMYSVNWRNNFILSLEAYCDRYADITLTPDGYVLGCASEVSRPDYYKYSAGNIKDKPLDQILRVGNIKRCSCQNKFSDCNYSCITTKFS